jgi:hypothetical protein
VKKIMLVIDDYNELEFLESLLRRLGFDILSLSKDLSVASSILGFFPDLVIAQAKSRSVDGLALAPKIKRLAPNSRMLLLHGIGQAPRVSPEQKNSIDALMETPVDAQKLIFLLAQLGNMDENALKEKFAKIASAKMTEEKRIRLQGKITSDANESQFITGKTQGHGITHVTGGAAKTKDPLITQSGPEQKGGIHHIQGQAKAGGSTHIQGENKTKSPAHIQGTGAPGQKGAAYMPTQGESEKAGHSHFSGEKQNGGAGSPDAETDRSKRYAQFLAEHDEPVDGTLPQAVLRKEAKNQKIDTLSDQNEIDAKREFVRALFRK